MGPARQTEYVDFQVFDDAVDEAEEGFIIVLDADEPTNISQVAFTWGLRTTLVRITDDDRKQYNVTKHLKCYINPYTLPMQHSTLGSLKWYIRMMKNVMKVCSTSHTEQHQAM